MSNMEHPTPATAAKQTKKKKNKINGILILCMFAVTIVTVVALAINTVSVAKKSVGSGTEDTVTDTGNSMKNELYTIGNNPTALEEQYFQELTDAIASGDKLAIAEKVAINFTADYFTWNNKDGNYDVGGLQYLYGSGYKLLESYTRWNYQEDFDLYLTKYGRSSLPEISAVNVVSSEKRDEDFTVRIEWPFLDLPCYHVWVTLEYKPQSGFDFTPFPVKADYFIVDHDGRMEIVEFYAWPEGQG